MSPVALPHVLTLLHARLASAAALPRCAALASALTEVLSSAEAELSAAAGGVGQQLAQQAAAGPLASSSSRGGQQEEEEAAAAAALQEQEEC